MNVKVFTGENPDVKKYIFEKDDICVEAVLYKYESYQKRTVLCVSTQCGCPVGCTFCGTGKKFIRNLTTQEIVDQVTFVVRDVESQIDWPLNSVCEKFQIMFMSMGEPMLNWDNVAYAIRSLNSLYPNAQLLISTMGVKDPEVFRSICHLSDEIQQIGLQFSVHETDDELRDEIIPFKNKMSLREIRDAGMLWYEYTNRPVYLNFCLPWRSPGPGRLYDLFSPSIFHLTFSVICKAEEGKKTKESKDLEQYLLYLATSQAIKEGYNVRQFDPAGQDDIGGGCGQLWYTQSWMKARSV